MCGEFCLCLNPHILFSRSHTFGGKNSCTLVPSMDGMSISDPISQRLAIKSALIALVTSQSLRYVFFHLSLIKYYGEWECNCWDPSISKEIDEFRVLGYLSY